MSGMKIGEISNVLILSHFYKRTQSGGGPPQEIRDFFLPKVKKIFYIEHPFPYSKDHRSSLTIYENGKREKQHFSFAKRGPDLLSYVADFLFTLYFLIISRSRFDICVSLDNLNTSSVIPFHKLKIIKKLVFYTIDYNPKRFKNETLNSIYHFLDRVSCYNSDVIWVLSEIMIKERVKNGVDRKRSAKSIVLPMGANLQRIKTKPITKIKRHQIVYAGHLLEKQGVQIVLEALPLVVKKIPDIKFIIVGEGEYGDRLKAQAKEFGVEKNVVFKGFVKSHKALEEILTASALGIAPYVDDPENYTRFTDPGKPKLYLGCGLPVVITQVPKIADEIHKKRAGIKVTYDSKSIADSIIKLISNDRIYEEFRRSAIDLSKKYDTNSLIASALARS